MKLETLAIHAAQEPEAATGAISPSIHLSTTFERDSDGEFRRGYEYVRSGNPNRNALEQCVTQLEGGAETVAFSSGMAAVQAVLQALAPGDHVLLPDDCYYGVRALTQGPLRRWGMRHSTVDMTDLDQVRASLQPDTRLVWVETPSNPLVKVVDIAAIAEIAHAAQAHCGVDNTWATPVLQQPLRLGADMVMHSSTKYFGGHSDVMGGTVTVAEQGTWLQRLRECQTEAGAVLGAFDSWLTLRGIQTLAYRIRAQCDHAAALAAYLAEHSGVSDVFYPGLTTSPYYHLSSSQMAAAGGMLSFCVKGDSAQAMRVAAKAQLIRRATSLGGTHTLIEHRASIEGPDTQAPANLLRLAVGLEHPDDLIEDLAQALA